MKPRLWTTTCVIRGCSRSMRPVVGLFIGGTMLVGLLLGVEPSGERAADRQEASILVEQRGAKQRLTSVLDEGLGKKIAKIRGVADVVPGLVDFTSLEELGDDAIVVNGWEAASRLMKDLEILPGGRPLKAEDKHCVLLGERLAADLEKRVGDTTSLYDTEKFKVVGIFRSRRVYESRTMVMLLADLQRIMGRKDQVSGFAVFVEHPDDKAEVNRIIKAINELGPKANARSTEMAAAGPMSKWRRRQDGPIIVTKRDPAHRLSAMLDEKLGNEIRKIRGVASVSGGLVDFTSLEEPGGNFVIVNGWEADSPLMKKLGILSGGRVLKRDDKLCALLGEEIATALGKKVGDTIALYGTGKLTVVGIFRSSIGYEARGIIVLLPDLQRLIDRRDQVSGFVVVAEHPENEAEVDRIMKAIRALGAKVEVGHEFEPVEDEKTNK
jgi:hypothetical protein